MIFCDVLTAPPSGWLKEGVTSFTQSRIQRSLLSPGKGNIGLHFKPVSNHLDNQRQMNLHSQIVSHYLLKFHLIWNWIIQHPPPLGARHSLSKKGIFLSSALWGKYTSQWLSDCMEVVSSASLQKSELCPRGQTNCASEWNLHEQATISRGNDLVPNVG